MRNRLLIGVLLALAVAPATTAGEPAGIRMDEDSWTIHGLWKTWNRRRCWCPDDYLSKCQPVVPGRPCGRGDDYQPKCVPACSPKTGSIGCADYCPPPCLLWLRPAVTGGRCLPANGPCRE